MSVARRQSTGSGLLACGPRHPNEFDLVRIERAIAGRARYRYVTPRVLPVADGYVVRSPCCSRVIDPAGGEIDVAWLLWVERSACWALHRKDHRTDSWVEDGRYTRLAELFARLNADPQRVFWQ